MPKQIWSKGAAALAAAIIGATALPGANAAELLNASYDVARELFQDLNPPFISAWDKAHPDAVSHMPGVPSRRSPFFRD